MDKDLVYEEKFKNILEKIEELKKLLQEGSTETAKTLEKLVTQVNKIKYEYATEVWVKDLIEDEFRKRKADKVFSWAMSRMSNEKLIIGLMSTLSLGVTANIIIEAIRIIR